MYSESVSAASVTCRVSLRSSKPAYPVYPASIWGRKKTSLSSPMDSRNGSWKISPSMATADPLPEPFADAGEADVEGLEELAVVRRLHLLSPPASCWSSPAAPGPSPRRGPQAPGRRARGQGVPEGRFPSGRLLPLRRDRGLRGWNRSIPRYADSNANSSPLSAPSTKCFQCVAWCSPCDCDVYLCRFG